MATATASRSSFATDSVTALEGTLELEAGAGVARGNGLESVVSLRYGAGPRSELFVNTLPFLQERVNGEMQRGSGPTEIGWRERLVETTEGTVGVQGFVRLPNGSERSGLATGETEWFLGGIVDRYGEHVAYTLFYQLGALGAEGSGHDTQHALSVVLGTPINERADAFLEVFGEFTRARSENPVATQIGAAWMLDSGVVLDAAFQFGLNNDAPDDRVLFGLTWNLGAVRGTRRDALN